MAVVRSVFAESLYLEFGLVPVADVRSVSKAMHHYVSWNDSLPPRSSSASKVRSFLTVILVIMIMGLLKCLLCRSKRRANRTHVMYIETLLLFYLKFNKQLTHNVSS